MTGMRVLGVLLQKGKNLMVQQINGYLSGIPMTVLGGVALLVSLVCSGQGPGLAFDPAWIAVVVSGIPLLCLAVSRLIRNRGMKKISSALLISIAMLAAIAIGDVFAAGEVAFIMAVGAILEEKTTERARKGLHRLLDLVPRQGRRIEDGREEVISAEDIRVHDVLRVLPGESVPVDGRIIRGNTSVDQAVITGESLPVDKGPGDEVFCGTLNRFGVMDMEAVRVGENSSLQRLIHMVREAEKNKAPIERIADVWATWLVPVALLIAVVTGLGTGSLVRAVTVLVVFCPCALVLATPTAVMAAIGQAARHGVIIKSGAALERMGKVDTVAFDKTGTLTYGRLTVSDVVSLDSGMDRRLILQLAASVENFSGHPLARAIVACARQQRLEHVAITNFYMVPGKGVKACLENKEILCGSVKWLEEQGIPFGGAAQETLNALYGQGKAVIAVAWGGTAVGIIALSDTLREGASGIVSQLKKTGTGAVLLTGDHAQTAWYFAERAGISDVYPGLMPEQKVGEIRMMQKQGRHVCMIGDGINDAPALKAADVGVAMGAMGSDIAMDAADIALLDDDLSKVPYLKRLSNAAVRTIQLSIGLSLAINLGAIVLSVQGYLTPTTGALVHNAGSVFVVLLAALLYDRNFIDEKRREGGRRS